MNKYEQVVSIKEMIVDKIAQQLTGFSETARLDAEILVSAVVKKSRTELLTYPETPLSKKQQKKIMELGKRRLLGEPIAYIVGKKEFWSLNLRVTPDVLIPRPETEILVEYALNLFPENKKIRIADLGTGSGAIALSLALVRPNWKIDATDNSLKALQVAKINAKHYDIKNVNFHLGSWCEALPHSSYHAILGNPPYIPKRDKHLQQLKYEPQESLTGGLDGLSEIKMIIREAQRYLKTSGWLLLEHGFNQGEKIRVLMRNSGYRKIKNCKDLSGLPRMIVGNNN